MSTKQRLMPLAIGLGLLGLISTAAIADPATDNNSAGTGVASDQSTSAQSEPAEKVTHKKHHRRHHRHHHHVVAETVTTEQHVAVPQQEEAQDSSANAPRLHSLTTAHVEGAGYLPVDLDVPGQSFVSSGPYIGIPLQYSGSNLIINAPSVNRDVALLKLRRDIHERQDALGIKSEENHTHLLLSGTIEGQAAYVKKGASGQHNSDIDISSAALEAYILGPDWISGLISLNYDNDTGPNSGSTNNNSRTVNSRVIVDKAFVTIGDLRKSPIYGTFGQLYVPFGAYSSSMVTSPVTKSMARTKGRAIVLGYQPTGDNQFFGSTYVFRGDSMLNNSAHINNGGVNFGYRFKQDKISGEVGAGAIANLADSVGMQDTGNNAPNFSGFGGTNGSGSELLQHRVPAYDLRGIVGIGDDWDFLGEWISATTSFSPTDMSVNGHGAKPQALNFEAAYTFTALTKPSSVAFGYGYTNDALALGLPKDHFSLVFITSIWRDTLQSLEFRHARGYGTHDVSTGSGVAGPSGTGQANNGVTAQFDVYF